MKLSVIGGGGVRSVFLAKSIAGRSESLGINEVVFSDTDARKLEIYGGLAKGAAARLAPGLKFVLTTDKTEAVKDADYVITTIRQGGDMLRVADERAALDLGLLGQETTGAAGFGFAMRSLPALVGYCELALKYAKPEVKIFNFTNPAGLMTQSLACLGYSNAFGVCDAPSGMLRQFADYLGADVKDLRAECYGLNHLSFFADITLNGQSVMRKLMEDDEAYKHTDLRFFDKSKVLELGEIPNEYLYYYFSPEKAVRNILTSGKTRGETIAEINRCMTEELSLPQIKGDYDKSLEVFEKWHGRRENAYMATETGVKRDKPWHFDLYSPDDGGYAGVALKYMDIVRDGGTGEMILCVRNVGGLDFLENDDTVEITCDVSSKGAVPHKIHVGEGYQKQIITLMKQYERLASEALINKSVSAAVEALSINPFVDNRRDARTLVDRFLQISKDYTYDWK